MSEAIDHEDDDRTSSTGCAARSSPRLEDLSPSAVPSPWMGTKAPQDLPVTWLNASSCGSAQSAKST